MKNASRSLAVTLSISLSLFLAGCSQDVASIDDVRTPMFSQDQFPIAVQKVPVKLTLHAERGHLSEAESAALRQFAREARNALHADVTVSHPSRSRKAKTTAEHAVRILSSEGIARDAIRISSYNGTSDVVSLMFMRKAAVTEPCGDWSRNIANDSKNEGYPNFGCSAQHNLATVVANPEDFEKPRTMTSTPAAGQMPAMKTYESGEWSRVPAPLPTATMGSGS